MGATMLGSSYKPDDVSLNNVSDIKVGASRFDSEIWSKNVGKTSAKRRIKIPPEI
jgi:hypothetical protein